MSQNDTEQKKFKITVNPDKEHVSEIRKKLVLNNNYCPCQLIKTEETKCMCKDFREQEIEGYCHCQLYRKDIIN